MAKLTEEGQDLNQEMRKLGFMLKTGLTLSLTEIYNY